MEIYPLSHDAETLHKLPSRDATIQDETHVVSLYIVEQSSRPLLVAIMNHIQVVFPCRFIFT